MSPEAKRDFEARWTLLERRARSFLSRKHVPVCDQEDLLQELAVRLLRMWDSIDQDRSLWPLTSTILLNLLRDRSRSAPRHDVVALIPDLEAPHDVERAGLARVELDRVRRAMDHLSSSHRTILMQELRWTDPASASPADKMLRMRARRKLRSIMEKVSGLVVLRVRRIAELGDKLFVLREGAATTTSCVICLVLGIGGAVVTPSALTPQASAGPVRSPSTSFAAMDGVLQASNETKLSPSLQDRVAEARRAQEAARAEAASSSSSSSQGRRDRQRKGKKAASSDQQGLLPGLPGNDGDGGVGLPGAGAVTPETTAPGISPPDPGDGPTVEPPSPPSPPPPPPPPPPPVNVLPDGEEIVDEVASLL